MKVLLILNIAVSVISLLLKLSNNLFSIPVVFFILPIIFATYSFQLIKKNKKKESYIFVGVTTVLTLLALSSFQY